MNKLPWFDLKSLKCEGGNKTPHINYPSKLKQSPVSGILSSNHTFMEKTNQ